MPFFKRTKQIALKDASPEHIQGIPVDPHLARRDDMRANAVHNMVQRRQLEKRERQIARKVCGRFESVMAPMDATPRLSRKTSAHGGASLALGRSTTRLSLEDGLEDDSARHSASSEIGHERRVSRVMRHLKTSLRSQVDSLNATLKTLITMFLGISIFQGILQMAWHAQLANVLEQHTGLLRAYNLVITPAIWYGVVFVTCIVTLCYVRSLNDQALLRGLRRLIGLAPMDDDDENPEDAILDDFKTIIDGLNEKLDLIGSQGQKMQNLVSSFSGFADNAKRLAERLIENRHEQFGDEELRKSLVSNVSDVCYEFFTQLKDGRPDQIFEQQEFANREEAEVAREANLKKVEMVKEVNRLILNLKHWSSTKYEAQAEGRWRADTLTPSWATPSSDQTTPGPGARGTPEGMGLGQRLMRSVGEEEPADMQSPSGAASGLCNDGGGGVGLAYAANYPEDRNLSTPSAGAPELNWKQATDERGDTYYYVATYERPPAVARVSDGLASPSPPPSPPPPVPPPPVPPQPVPPPPPYRRLPLVRTAADLDAIV
jgi:hypothetical protein